MEMKNPRARAIDAGPSSLPGAHAQVQILLMRVCGGFVGVLDGPRRAYAAVHRVAGMRNRYTSLTAALSGPYPAMRGKTIAPAVPEWTYSPRGVYKFSEWLNVCQALKPRTKSTTFLHSGLARPEFGRPGATQGLAVDSHMLDV